MPECVEERRNGKHYCWHMVGGEGDDWFRPIACHDTEGIVLPFPSRERQPTCVACYALWRLNDATPEPGATRNLPAEEGATGG